MTSITPFLWFDNNVPEAVAFYKSVFPNAKVETVNDFMASFELEGQKFNALNGGPKFKFNEAISFFISVETQEQVDYFWSRLTADGGEESMCGWLKDKFGLSWQVVPTALGRYLSDPDRTKADRAMQAMMKMRKIVIAIRCVQRRGGIAKPQADHPGQVFVGPIALAFHCGHLHGVHGAVGPHCADLLACFGPGQRPGKRSDDHLRRIWAAGQHVLQLEQDELLR